MGSSPDVSGAKGLGRPQTLNFTEQEQSAETINNKLGLAAIKNSIDIPLTQLGGNIFKYEAHSSKPTLARTLFAQMVRSDKPLENELAKEIFKKLKDKLPLQLQMGLKHYSALPWEERDARFILLELLLKFAARSLAFLQGCTEVDETDLTERSSRYQTNPAQSLKGWERAAWGIRSEFLESARNCSGMDQRARDAAENVKILNGYIKHVRAAVQSKGRLRAKLIAKTLKALNVDLEQIHQGKTQGIAPITEDLLDMLRALLSSLRLKKGKAFYYVLYLVGEGYYNKNTRCFGSALQETAEAISAPFDTVFGKYLLAFAVVTYVPFVVSASHLKSLEAKEEERFETGSFQALALKLASALIANSGAVESALETLTNILSMPEKETFTAAASSFAYSVLPLNAAIGKHRMKNAEALLEGVKEPLRDALSKLPVETANRAINAAVKQARIAVDRGEGAAFIQAVNSAAASLDVDGTRLPGECAEITEEAGVLLDALHDLERHGEMMNIIRQVA